MIEGHIYTEGVIKEGYDEEIKAQLAALPADTQLIIHHIKSPGGNVYAAWKALPELMKAGKPIDSYIEGEASSVASWIAVAPSRKLYATNPSTSMIHEPFYPDGISGALRVDDLDGAKIELEQIRLSMAEAYAKKSGKPVQYWLDKMKGNTRLTANMLKSEGLVDEVIEIEPRRIAALVEDMKNEFNEIKNEIMNLFSKKAVAEVKAVDLPLKNGSMVHIESENGDLVGKPITIDGKPAEGAYDLQDGRKLVCVAGKVTEVTQATQAPPPEETAEQKIAKLTAELASIKSAEELKAKAALEASEKAKLEELVKAVEAEKNKAAAIAKELDEFKNKEVGKEVKPNEGMTPNRTPYGMASTSDDRMKIAATRTVLADHLPWLERYYNGGKYDDGTAFSSYRSAGGPNAVSILETNLNYTWNGNLALELFFKPTISSPALGDIFTIDLGSADKKRYHISPVMNKVLKPYTGCDQAVTGSSFNITSKFIQLKPFEMYEGWCKDDFTDQLTGSYNVLAQEWLKTGTASFDPAGTPIDRMIIQLLKDALRRDIFRRVSFGDTTSSSADWNQIDGYWQSLIDQSGASNYCVYRDGAALGTGTLSAGTALARFQSIYNNSSNLLKDYAIDSGRGQFLVTRSVWDNYYDSLAANGAVTEQAFGNLVNGAKPLTFKGIPIVPITLWDDQLADSTNPLASTTKHLISFTVKDNHILGVENTSDLDKIDSWFEKKDNKRYYRSNMILGFLGAIHCELTTIAY